MVEPVHAVADVVAVVVLLVVVAFVFPSVCLALHHGTVVLFERKDPDHASFQNRHHLAAAHKLLHAMLHHLRHFRHDALLPLHRLAHLRELIVGLVGMCVVVVVGMTTQAETRDERAERSREGRTVFAPARLGVGECKSTMV
jgi:hypothetical protein